MIVLLLLIATVVCLLAHVELPDPELDRRALAAMLDAMAEVGISQKAAAISMRYSQSHFSEICAGTKQLPSTTRLLRLGPQFIYAFVPKLTRAVAELSVIDIVHDAQVRAQARASLKKSSAA